MSFLGKLAWRVAVLILVGSIHLYPAPLTIRVSSVKGEASYLTQEDGWRRLPTGSKLLEGSVIEAGLDSYLVLRIDGDGKSATAMALAGALLKLDSISDLVPLTWATNYGRVTVSLLAGSIAVNVRPRLVFEVVLTNGTAAVRGPGKFQVYADGRIYPVEGIVDYAFRLDSGEIISGIVETGFKYDPAYGKRPLSKKEIEELEASSVFRVPQSSAPAIEWQSFRPWPPPPSSGRTMLPDLVPRSQGATLGDLADRLSSALGHCGYADWSFLKVPGGFALVTQIEQIDESGLPKNGFRWLLNVPSLEFVGSWQYLRDLLSSNPGFFRAFVFVVTDKPFSRSGEVMKGGEILKKLNEGLVRLPSHIITMPYSEDHSCEVLVYEFEGGGRIKKVTAKVPGKLTAKQHLEKAGLRGFLEKNE